MVTATITSKGQITIPKAVRDSLHLHSGDKVAFILRDGGETLFKPVTKSVDQVFGAMREPGRPARTVTEMNEAIAHRLRGDRP